MKAQIGVHSHNDYSRPDPFLAAYNAGAYSIEADLFRRGDTLYVAHSTTEIKAGRTLESLYFERIKKLENRSGHKMQLMLDIKEKWSDISPVLLKKLREVEKVLKKKGIMTTISGNRPPHNTYHSFSRMINFDGLPDTIYNAKDLRKVVMISANFNAYSAWKG
ncbi:MAG: alkaline phosphatase, partial [Pedobacter sp.]